MRSGEKESNVLEKVKGEVKTEPELSPVGLQRMVGSTTVQAAHSWVHASGAETPEAQEGSLRFRRRMMGSSWIREAVSGAGITGGTGSCMGEVMGR